MATIERVRVMLGFDVRKVPELVAGSKNVHDKMSADIQQYPTPNPAMPALLTLIQSVESSQTIVASGVKGAKQTRNTKATALVAGLDQEVMYVQGLADNAGSTEAATAIALGAGMKIAAVGVHPKAPLALRNVQPSGTVEASAYAHLLVQGSKKGRVFNWQYNTDGKNWMNLPSTPVSKITISGLTSLSTVAVRVAITLGKQPMGEWSQVVTLLVQ